MMVATVFSVPLLGRPGLMELVLILVAVLVLFGGSKLPKLGKGLGEGIRNFKNGLKGEDSEPVESPTGQKPDMGKLT